MKVLKTPRPCSSPSSADCYMKWRGRYTCGESWVRGSIAWFNPRYVMPMRTDGCWEISDYPVSSSKIPSTLDELITKWDSSVEPGSHIFGFCHNGWRAESPEEISDQIMTVSESSPGMLQWTKMQEFLERAYDNYAMRSFDERPDKESWRCARPRSDVDKLLWLHDRDKDFLLGCNNFEYILAELDAAHDWGVANNVVFEWI